MIIPSSKLLILSTVLTGASTFAAWILTVKVAGESAGVSFFWLGVSFVIGILTVQVVLYLLDRNRVLYRQLFGVAFGLSLVWFMICLFLPLFFVESISVLHKVAIAVFFLFVAVCNFLKGISHFDRRWSEKGERCLVKSYDQGSNALDWQRVVKPMHLTATLYVPGVPERVTPLLSVVLIISMMLGLNVRSTFPVFAIFAWGIPSALIASFFVQMIGLGWAQVMRIAKIEKDAGRKIKVAKPRKSRMQ